MIRLATIACAFLGSSAIAAAEPVQLRFATPVPDGTAWAREGNAFARDVEAATGGQVRVRWIMGGIAGDELQMIDRVARQQVDGMGSGGMACERLAPSLRATRLIGLFRDRAETNYVLGRLRATLDEEYDHAGYANLFETLLGPDLAFSREPVRTLDDLKRQRLWIWDLDEVFGASMGALGVKTVPLPLASAARAFDEGKSDGFFAIPVAALAFQWSAQVRYVSPLPIGFLTGCLLVAHRAFDGMPVELQKAVRSAAAKFAARLEAMSGEQDRALLGGLFGRQGVTTVPVSDALRREFLERARAVRDSVDERLIPAALRKRVDGFIEEYRRAH